jgi:hypothetical protein
MDTINSLLYAENIKYDYIDSYKYVIRDSNNEVSIFDVAEAFAKPSPRGISNIMIDQI